MAVQAFCTNMTRMGRCRTSRYRKEKGAAALIFQSSVQQPLYTLYPVGVTGFEPATSRPPAVRSNQTEPHPANEFYYMKFRRDCKEKYDDFANFFPSR